MNEGMMGAVVGVIAAVERGDAGDFTMLIDEALRENARGFVMAALGTVWQLAGELAKLKQMSTDEVLRNLAMLAAQGEAGLFDDGQAN